MGPANGAVKSVDKLLQPRIDKLMAADISSFCHALAAANHSYFAGRAVRHRKHALLLPPRQEASLRMHTNQR